MTNHDETQGDPLEISVNESYAALNTDQKKVVEKKVVDICYSRGVCDSLGVDYTTLPAKDMIKIYMHAMGQLGYLTS